jgi:multidrug efflux pump
MGAFFIMYLMGYSINVLTLFAIVLATGLVVDDGIVVTENIYKKIEKGMNPKLAAIEGSKEIFFAVISTSITLAAVFLPVIFMDGFVGRLFREFGVVIAGAVLISAFVSLTLTPMLNARMVRKNPAQKSKFYLATEPFFQGMENAYAQALSSFLEVKYMAWVILVFVLGITAFIYPRIPSELAPLEDRSWMRLIVTAPEGASFEYTDAIIYDIIDFVTDSIPEKRALLTVTAPGFTGSGAVNTGFVRIALTPPETRKRSQQQLAGYVMKNIARFPEARIVAIQQQTISTGGFGGLPVQFVIQAPDFERLKDKLPLFLEKARKNPIFQGVDVNLKFNKPEILLTIDRERAKALGVSVLSHPQVMVFEDSPHGLRAAVRAGMHPIGVLTQNPAKESSRKEKLQRRPPWP